MNVRNRHRTGARGRAWGHALLVLLAVSLARPALGGTESVETWSGAGTAGWSNETTGATLNNPGGYLAFQFNQQSAPVLVEDRAWVDLPIGVVLTNLQFTFRAGDTPPSALRVVLQASTNGHTWQLNLDQPVAGPWFLYTVPLVYAPAWCLTTGGDSAEAFAADLPLVDRVAVYVRRHGSPAAQEYGIDDFTLQGLALDPRDRDGDGMPDDWETLNEFDPENPGDAGDDADGDGMTNYAEYRAGSNPRDATSVFDVQIARVVTPTGTPVEGVVLSWNSISNRTYAIWRTLDLRSNGLDRIDSGVAATPPVNIYEAPVATNESAAFYRIEVEAP
ncbi:MAG: hypothetical protein K8T26_04035 [Lentisphaerae bacterium]|nr:hypothetical protein [Lentisphaerota bacterium]